MKRKTLLNISVIAVCVVANLAYDIPHMYRDVIMSEVAKNSEMFLRREMAYSRTLSYHGVGSWKEIGFEPDGCIYDAEKTENCHTEQFRYFSLEGIDAPLKGLGIELLDSLQDCPAGAQWEAFVFRGLAMIREPENATCIRLLPNFRNVLEKYKTLDKPQEIASQLQPTFAALFHNMAHDFSDSTVPNLWINTEFSIPSDSVGKNWFNYEEIPAYMKIIESQIYTGIRATLQKNLGDCPAGTVWEGFTVANINDDGRIAVDKWKGGNLCQLIKLPLNDDCIALTPHIQELQTCDTVQWKENLDLFRMQKLEAHRDSVKRRIVFYKDSVRQKEIADSLSIEECKKNGGKIDGCYSLFSIVPGGSSDGSIEEYDYSEPLNVWKVFSEYSRKNE